MADDCVKEMKMSECENKEEFCEFSEEFFYEKQKMQKDVFVHFGIFCNLEI